MDELPERLSAKMVRVIEWIVIVLQVNVKNLDIVISAYKITKGQWRNLPYTNSVIQCAVCASQFSLIIFRDAPMFFLFLAKLYIKVDSREALIITQPYYAVLLQTAVIIFSQLLLIYSY